METVNKYKKKPVEIEALIWVGDNTDVVATFVGMDLSVVTTAGKGVELHIPTLEDGSSAQVAHMATVGDYIIKGIKGEFYACKPDIFKLTYDIV